MTTMTNDMLDIIEQNMMGGRKNTPAAAAARAVLVSGMSRPEAQLRYGVTRSTLHDAIRARTDVLDAALRVAQLAHQHN